MTKPTPKAADTSTIRQRAALARDAAGRFIRRGPPKHDAPVTEPAAPRDGAEPGVELLALIPEWEAANETYARLDQACIEVCRIAEGDGHPGPSPEGSGPDWRAWHDRVEEWRRRTGVASAEEASGDALRALGEVEDRIAELPAATLAGLRFKARVAQRCDDIEVEWPDGLGAGLVRDILAFVETAPIGRPDLAGPAPLSAAILDGWAAWAATLGKPEWDADATAAYERAVARRDELLGAAEALPAIKASVAPKALALAWLSFVEEERPRETRAQHSFTGRIALDVHKAILSSSEAPSPAPRSDDGPSLVDRIDFASATMEELRAIHDTADMVGGVAYAAAWQGRCHRRGTPVAQGVMNPAGDLMQWLGDALTEVEGTAIREAERRRQLRHDDRGIRLALMAPDIIENGDPGEIARLIRELAEHVAAEAEGR